MDLSAEQFAAIISELESAGRGDPARDKRRSPRLLRRGTVEIVPGPQNSGRASVHVQLRDFSPRGLCIIMDTPIDAGEQFVVRLGQRPLHDTPICLLCTAVYCRTTNGQAFMIGAEFTCVLPPTPTNTPTSTPADLDRIRSSILA